VRKFRVIPAVLVSKRNDEIPLARVTALTKAGRDFGFDTIYDLRVEGHSIVRKIYICLRDDGQSKKYDEGSEKHIDKLPGNDSDWKARVGWGLARQVGHPARLNLPTPALYLQGQRESSFFPSVLPVAAALCLINMRLRGAARAPDTIHDLTPVCLR
jgi:hypothetical protein